WRGDVNADENVQIFFRANLNSPLPNSFMGWEGFWVNLSWYNPVSLEYIANAEVTLRYADAFNQPKSLAMTSDGHGNYLAFVTTTEFDSASTINFEVEFSKLGYVNASVVTGTAFQFSVTVNNGLPPFTFGIPTVVLIVVILIIFFVFSIWLAFRYYQKRIVIPEQQKHQQKLQEVLDLFSDVSNLSRILVLHRGSGIAIFDPFKERGMDASLIGGFLQAIQAFAIDVADDSNGAALQPSTRLSEITYEGFRVLIHDGKYTRTAIVYRGTPSQTLREKISLFSEQFEEKYHDALQNRGYEPGVFSNATDLLESIFHISLLFPHKVEIKSKEIRLTNLESRLHYVAFELTKNRQFISLQEIVNSYLETIQENPLELLNAIYQLRKKGILTPAEFYSLSNGNNVAA
ncbi:MAG: hypothetical protein ACFFD8_09560, partial [Candidatus Thorarchaeota archaeon]